MRLTVTVKFHIDTEADPYTTRNTVEAFRNHFAEQHKNNVFGPSESVQLRYLIQAGKDTFFDPEAN